jgi:hypothetical protein
MFKKLFGKKEKAEVSQVEIHAAEIKKTPDYEVQAAIAVALHLFVTEMHDFEKTILTIQKVMRPYSPWSSKIYGLRKSPR